MTDTQETMRDAQSLHRLRMMPKDQQDVAIIMHYAAAVAVAMQGSRLVESKRFGGDSEYLNEAISYVADLLRKVHQTDFGTTLPCNGMVCTAQSAEKIARLEDDVAHYKQINHVQLQGWTQDHKRAAAAELSNKQLREALEPFYRRESDYMYESGNKELVADLKGAKKALAQQPSTEALDAYVAKLTKWQPIETAPKDGTKILVINDAGYIGTAVAMGVCWVNDDTGVGENVVDVIGWMPLPPSPEQKG